MKRRFLFAIAGMMLAALFITPVAFADNGVAMYRLYNPNSGEHFYTADVNERNEVIQAGWNYENVGWMAPTQGDPVYRLYNVNGGEHHYTLDANERDMLVSVGWSDEGRGWYSDSNKGKALHREYNPNAFANNHNYTADTSEHASLLSIGWNDEGVAWYALNIEPVDPNPLSAEFYEMLSLNGWWQSVGHSGMTWEHVVNGTMYGYSYFQNSNYPEMNSRRYLGSSAFTVKRFNAGAAKIRSGGGYEVQFSSVTGYLHFDSEPNMLDCASLDGKRYSATDSLYRADPPQDLIDLARENE